MSTKNHPNLHAIGFTCDLIESFYKRLRGDASKDATLAFALVHDAVVAFVTDVSSKLDDAFENQKEGE